MFAHVSALCFVLSLYLFIYSTNNKYCNCIVIQFRLDDIVRFTIDRNCPQKGIKSKHFCLVFSQKILTDNKVSPNLSFLRWIYTVSVFRTFSSVFLRFCFSLTKYALFHPHFYKSISALSRLLYINKNFVQKFCVWTIRAIFRNKAVPLHKKNFSENFCPVCDRLVSADMDT